MPGSMWPEDLGSTLRAALKPFAAAEFNRDAANRSGVLIGFDVRLVHTVASTNTSLLLRGRNNECDPCLLAAWHQTAGRGRLGRSWVTGLQPNGPGNPHDSGSGNAAVAADALTFSVGLALHPVDWSGLSLVVGTALAQALHPDVRLKWPNDLWLCAPNSQGRKLGGILIETVAMEPQDSAQSTYATAYGHNNPGLQPRAGTPRYCVIGVGINLAERDADGLRTAPAALHERVPGATAADVLTQVAAPLLKAVRAFEADGFEPWRAAFAQRDALRGQHVTLSDGQSGVASGVDACGGLLVRSHSGVVTVTSSEVSVRPSSQAGELDAPAL